MDDTTALQTYQWDYMGTKVNKFRHRLTVENFRQLTSCIQYNEHRNSSKFSFGKNINWYYRIYPKYGRNIRVELLCEYSQKIDGNYKLSLMNKKKEMIAKEPELLWQNGSTRSIEYPLDDVLDEANGYLENGCLTIECEITLLSTDVINLPSTKIYQEPFWLEKLFLSDHLSDMKFIASCGKSIPAHKTIICAYNPVFEMMFTHEMKEKRLNEVTINREYEVIREMLRFIYTGKVMDIKSVAYELFQLAHMYEMEELVKLCGIELIDQISVENVLTILSIVEKYDGLEILKTLAVIFIKKMINSTVDMDIDTLEKLYVYMQVVDK